MGQTRKFGKDYYRYYNHWGTKREAQADANRLRKKGIWLVRMVKCLQGGYDLFTRQKPLGGKG